MTDDKITYQGKNVRVDEETYKRLQVLSKEEGRSLKEILRRSVKNYWTTEALFEKEVE